MTASFPSIISMVKVGLQILLTDNVFETQTQLYTGINTWRDQVLISEKHMSQIKTHFLLGNNKTLDDWNTFKKKFESKFITTATLSRYINNKLNISEDNAELLMHFLRDQFVLPNYLQEHYSIISGKEDTINTRKLLVNIPILKFFSYLTIVDNFDVFRDTDYIVAPEVDGIPLGVTVANLLQVPCVYVRKNKKYLEFPPESYYQVEVSRFKDIETLILSRNEIQPYSKIILCDDVVRSGKTVEALYLLLQKLDIHLEVLGVLCIASIRNNNFPFKVYSFLSISRR